MLDEFRAKINLQLGKIENGTYLYNVTDITGSQKIVTSSSSKHAPTEKGVIDEYRIFKGITISYQYLIGNGLNFHHEALNSSLEINHCNHGRIGIHMKHNQKVFLGEGDMALQPMDCCSDADITLPLGFYEGIMITIDLTKLTELPSTFFSNEMDTEKILFEKFCKKSEPLAIPANHKIEHIFCELYEIPLEYKLPYMKLKIIELILFLSLLNPNDETILKPYFSEQVEIIKSIHKKMVEHLDKRFTIEELAAEFLINSTTLKNTFKSVYGMPIATYMKQYRIQSAAKMLRESTDPISKIAAAVGYESQGKFTEAFKSQIGMSPTIYRKQYQ